MPDPLSFIMTTALANLISSADFINTLFVLLSRYFRRKSSNGDNHLLINVSERSFLSFVFFFRVKRDTLPFAVFNSVFAQTTDRKKGAGMDLF